MLLEQRGHVNDNGKKNLENKEKQNRCKKYIFYEGKPQSTNPTSKSKITPKKAAPAGRIPDRLPLPNSMLSR